MIADNIIHNQDCLEFMSHCIDDQFDMVVTSPPYNVGNNNMTPNKYKDDIDRKSKSEYRDWIFGVIKELLRVTKKHIFFNIQMLSDNKLTVLEMLGTFRDNIKDIIIWNKTQAMPSIEPGVMNSKFEFIIIFSKDRPELRKFYDTEFSIKNGTFANVITGNHAGIENRHSKIHQATFPLYLPRTILNNFGKEGELIYDPFMGMGTTALASLMEHRRYIGTEISSEYCELANKRIEQFKSQMVLFQ